MAPPNPIQCSVPTCNFTTPDNTPTWEMMTNLLKIHTDAVHRPPADQAAPGATSAKLEKISYFEVQKYLFVNNITDLQFNTKVSRTPPEEVRRRERELAAAQSAEVQTLLLTPFSQSPRLDFGQVGLLFVIGASQQLRHR